VSGDCLYSKMLSVESSECEFHQDYFELPGDGAPNASKHVGASWYTNI
jgi:hypothetical protein